MQTVPFNCFLSQHSVASQEREATDDGQILKGLEHVQVSPVDIHQTQHGYNKENGGKSKKNIKHQKDPVCNEITLEKLKVGDDRLQNRLNWSYSYQNTETRGDKDS